MVPRRPQKRTILQCWEKSRGPEFASSQAFTNSQINLLWSQEVCSIIQLPKFNSCTTTTSKKFSIFLKNRWIWLSSTSLTWIGFILTFKENVKEINNKWAYLSQSQKPVSPDKKISNLLSPQFKLTEIAPVTVDIEIWFWCVSYRLLFINLLTSFFFVRMLKKPAKKEMDQDLLFFFAHTK